MTNLAVKATVVLLVVLGLCFLRCHVHIHVIHKHISAPWSTAAVPQTLHEPASNSHHKCNHGHSAATAADGSSEGLTSFQPVIGIDSSNVSAGSISKEAEVRQLGDRAIGESGEGAFSLRRILATAAEASEAAEATAGSIAATAAAGIQPIVRLPTAKQTQEVQRAIYEQQQVADDYTQEQERGMLEQLQNYMQPGREVLPGQQQVQQHQQEEQFSEEYHQYQQQKDPYYIPSSAYKQYHQEQQGSRKQGAQSVLPQIEGLGGSGTGVPQQEQQQRSTQTKEQDLLMQSSTGPIQKLKTQQTQNHPYAQQQQQQQQQQNDPLSSHPRYGVPEVSVPRLVSGAPESLTGGGDNYNYNYNGGNKQPTFTRTPHGHGYDSTCNIQAGGWRFSKHRHSWYSGSSCPYIRPGFNCQLNGRNDTDFLQYYWQPHGCNLPQFNPKEFLNRYKNKVMAFVGDSISRNFQESLACQLASVEASNVFAIQVNGVNVSGIEFPKYNLRLVSILSPFLADYTTDPTQFAKYGVTRPEAHDIPNASNGGNSTETKQAAQYMVWLDRLDPAWDVVLPHIDLVMFMSGHWFQTDEGDTTVRQTVYMRDNQRVTMSAKDAYNAVLHQVRKRLNTYGGVPFWMTFSPAGYSAGSPPTCSAAQPLTQPQGLELKARGETSAFTMRQMEVNVLMQPPSHVKLLDVTFLSLLRPDALVKVFYGCDPASATQWDCVNWCLPGLPDVWTDMFQFLLHTKVYSM